MGVDIIYGRFQIETSRILYLFIKEYFIWDVCIIRWRKVICMRQRFPKWDNLKCVLIVMVVLGHCIETFTDDSYMFKRMWLMIYGIHMPLFIFVTGLFAKGAIDNREKLKNKVYAFIKMYFIYKVLLMLVKLIMTGKGQFSLLKESSIPWYLLAMVIYLIVTYMARNIKPGYLLALSVILACVIGYDRDVRDFLVLARAINFYPFFLMGYYAKTDMKIFESNAIKKILSALVLGVYGYIVWINVNKAYEFRPLLTGRNTYFSLEFPEYGILYRLAHYLIAIAVGLSIIYLIPNKVNSFTFIGKKTLYIYVLHGVFINILRGINWEEHLMDNLPPVIWKAVVLLSVIVLVGLCCLPIFEKAFAFVMNRRYVKDNKDNYEVDYSVFSMPPREVYREKQHPSEEILKGSKE